MLTSRLYGGQPDDVADRRGRSRPRSAPRSRRSSAASSSCRTPTGRASRRTSRAGSRREIPSTATVSSNRLTTSSRRTSGAGLSVTILRPAGTTRSGMCDRWTSRRTTDPMQRAADRILADGPDDDRVSPDLLGDLDQCVGRLSLDESRRCLDPGGLEIRDRPLEGARADVRHRLADRSSPGTAQGRDVVAEHDDDVCGTLLRTDDRLLQRGVRRTRSRRSPGPWSRS